MKTQYVEIKVSVLALAVQGALVAMFALPLVANAEDAANAETDALTHPTNYVEIGAMGVSHSSAKFGEYNGLDESGAYAVGNFDVRGGNAYDEGDGTMRWEIKGLDLGTTSRTLGGSVSNQGLWDLNISYDELRHNISDTYQTPQQGKMGGNSFTLPSTFGTFNAATGQPSARSLNPTQLGAFHTEQVGTSRKNTSFGAGFSFSPQISLKFDYNHLDQSGAKLIGFGALGGVDATTGTWRGEAVAIVMNPTNYTTDSVNLALNWVGDKGHLTTSYYGSIFRDDYNSISWQNPMLNNAASTCVAPGCTYQTNTASTMPDNQFHQLNFTGGYTFTPSTKLAGGFSYGRNTQNDNYLTNQMWGALPKSSLDGLVINTHADFKLTNQTTRDLVLSAGLKYNERDNRTSSNTYKFTNIAGGKDTATSTPMSNKKTQVELAGNYRLGQGQSINLAYEHEWYKRWCNNYAIDGNNPNAAGCAVSPSNHEDKLGLTYKLVASEAVKLNAGYAYANRHASFDHSAVTPLGVTVGLGIINGADLAGFIPFFEASRTQNMLKAGVDWQASEKLSLGLSGRYAKDEYNDSTLGVQDGRTEGINLDAAYSFSDQSTVSAYMSWQNRERDLRSGQAASNASSKTTYALLSAVPLTGIWTNRMEDDSKTIGINANHKGLMGGKLDIAADLSYSIDKTGYSTKVPYNAACATAAVLTCADLPDIENKLLTLKLTGDYQVNKSGKVAVGYMFQHRNSNDYYYNAYQYGFTPNRVMPTNEQAPDYSVSLLSVAYIYSF